jgi:hypothetical protein
MNAERITVGPFTWERADHDEHECWVLVRPLDLHMTFFVLKDYGNSRYCGSDSFSGWRVVSGGPFTNAGKWSSREEAMQGVVPWLTEWYEREIAERRHEAQRIADWLKGGEGDGQPEKSA